MDWKPIISIGIALGIAIVTGLVLGAIGSLAIRASARRGNWAHSFILAIRSPFRIFAGVIAFWIALSLSSPLDDFQAPTEHALEIVAIAVGAWLLIVIVQFVIGRAVERYPLDVANNRVARRIQTQLVMVRRVSTTIIVVLAVGAILLSFPAVRTVGASLLASAGIAGIVAGLAAQSTLANMFAGIQLTFTDAIRVDDVVVVEEEWGRIEEITLTYVVVHIWDDRRLVLPSTYFTTTPFENWTRKSSELLGSVDFDLDWHTPIAAMRDKLDEVMADAPLWDGRVKVLQVTDAVGGLVHVRILVTAIDSPTLFDLRCYVREQLLEWVQEQALESIPRTRIVSLKPPTAATPEGWTDHAAHHRESTEHEGLFTGSAEAEQRALNFTTPIDVIRPEPE